MRSRLHGLLLRGAATVLPSGLGRVADALGRLSDGFVVTCFEDGRRVRVRLDDGYWIPAAFGRPYEPEVEATLSRFLQAGTRFVDCGANIGWWSAFAAVRVGAENVTAIEPASFAYRQLEANAAMNGRFRTIHAAVWSGEGEVEVAVDTYRHAWASAAEDVRDALYRTGFTTERVPAVTIDGLDFTAGPTVIKLDVEGAELAALEGATRTLSSHDVVVVLEEHGRSRQRLASGFLRSLGFQVEPCDHGPDDRADPSRGYNYVAFRP